MTELLRKLFIKDYKNTSDAKVRKKHGFLASFVGTISNALLFGFKLFIGLFTASISIVTDAINNLSDMGSCVINIVGFKLAGKPADKKHPFGHERIEYIAGMIISFVIIGIAVFLGYFSVQKIINNEGVDISVWAFVILGAAILVKLWQSFFYKKIAKEINSLSLKASSQDSLNDVISTTCVLIVTIIEFILQKNNIKTHVSIDGIVGVCLATFIIIMGCKLIIETSNPLIGITPDNELVKSIVKEIKAYDGVLGVHDLMCHSYGPTKIYMSIHVEVDYRVNVMKSHDLIDNIEEAIYHNHNVILTIHMDPIDNDSPLVIKLKKEVENILKSYNKKLTFHDFRIVSGDTHTNILFDVLVPFEEGIKKDKLLIYINMKMKAVDPKYKLIIKFDDNYAG